MSPNANLEELFSRHKNSQKIRRLILIVMFGATLTIRIFFGTPLAFPIFILIIIWYLSSYLFDYIVSTQSKIKWANLWYIVFYIFDILILTAIIHYLGSWEWIGFSLYTFTIIFTNIMISRKAGLLMTTVVAFCYSGLVLLEYNGLLTHRHPSFLATHQHEMNYLLSNLLASLSILYMISYTSGFFSDILKQKTEELKEKDQQLFQSEKISSLGQMSASIVHEVNNPLFSISGETELLLRQETDADKKESLEKILHNTRRVTDITSRLLAFSKRQEIHKTLVNINSILEEVFSLVGFQLRSNGIELIKNLNSSLPRVYVDEVRIQEVCLNIIMNAAQAMPRGGKLTIKSYLKKIDRQDSLITKLKVSQETVILEFSDTGKGIPEYNFSKIFDPFFSTKDKNSGLGLAICYKIIQEHDGLIEVKSKLGQGSTFVVSLPTK